MAASNMTLNDTEGQIKGDLNFKGLRVKVTLFSARGSVRCAYMSQCLLRLIWISYKGVCWAEGISDIQAIFRV